MENNFDLKQFLIENKITSSTKTLLKESYDMDEVEDADYQEQLTPEIPMEEAPEQLDPAMGEAPVEGEEEDDDMVYEDLTGFLRELNRKVGAASLKKQMEITKRQYTKLEEKLGRLEEDQDLKHYMSETKVKQMKKMVKEMRKHEEKLGKIYDKKYGKDLKVVKKAAITPKIREVELKEAVNKIFKASK